MCSGVEDSRSDDIGEFFVGHTVQSIRADRKTGLGCDVVAASAAHYVHKLDVWEVVGVLEKGVREAAPFNLVDSLVALNGAFFVNAAILILAASTFHVAGRTDVAEIDEAYRLLAPMLGVGAASTLFAVALLAAGQNSTVTGTLAGQIVMEGFLRLKLPFWARRVITRGLAIVPAVLVVAAAGDRGATQLLILSQVVLSLQLPFAIVPLVRFTSDRALMGRFASPAWMKGVAWAVAAVIIGLNVNLLVGMALS